MTALNVCCSATLASPSADKDKFAVPLSWSLDDNHNGCRMTSLSAQCLYHREVSSTRACCFLLAFPQVFSHHSLHNSSTGMRICCSALVASSGLISRPDSPPLMSFHNCLVHSTLPHIPPLLPFPSSVPSPLLLSKHSVPKRALCLPIHTVQSEQ